MILWGMWLDELFPDPHRKVSSIKEISIYLHENLKIPRFRVPDA